VAFSRALTADPTSVPAIAGMVGLDVAAGRRAEARARLLASLAKNPTDAALLELASRTHMALGDPKGAEMALRKLLEVQPTSLLAYSALGQLYLAQGRLDEARREMEQYIARVPTAVGAHTMIGFTLQMQNRLEEAQKKYEQVLALDSKAAVAANNLAWLYAEKGINLDEALQLAQTAKSQIPNQAEIDDTLGWVYFKKGLPGLASASFRQSVARDPNNPGYQYHLGLALLKNGETAKAKESLQKALALKKDFPEAEEARRLLAGL
jgi:Tfp pilus assembly protein PilF